MRPTNRVPSDDAALPSTLIVTAEATDLQHVRPVSIHGPNAKDKIAVGRS